MIVYRCSKCHWIGNDPKFIFPDDECCPRCKSKEYLGVFRQKDSVSFASDELEKLWQLFGEIPTNDDDEIEDCFLDFSVGTNRFEVWLWFDGLYPEGVAALLENKK